MNKKVVFILGGLVFILLVALVAQTAYFMGQKKQVIVQDKNIEKVENENVNGNNKIIVDSKKARDSVELNTHSESKGDNNSTTGQGNDVDDSWFWYRNEATGFRIKLPKETALDGEKYKVKTFIGGPVAYISASKPAEKEILRRRNNKTISFYDKAGGVAFAVLIEKVKDKKELEQFIKNRYDKECKLGDIVKTSTPGVFDVGFFGDGEPGGACFINYMTVVKYYPDKNVVAAWDIGQAPNFWIDGKSGPAGSTKSFDMIISDSFEFLK